MSNKLFNWVKTLFAPKKSVGFYYFVNWSDEAKENALGNDCLKKIFYMYNGHLVDPSYAPNNENPEDYTKQKLEQLKSEGYNGFDLTAGQLIPKDSVFVPQSHVIMGNLEIKERL